MAATTTWDVSNLKAVQIDIDKFGHGKVVVNGEDITEKITEFTLTSVASSHVVLTATLVQPPDVAEPEPIVEDPFLDEVPETEVGPPEIPEEPEEVEL